MRVPRPLVFACLLGLVPLSGCSNSTGPTAGALNVSLSSPNTDDGAVLLTISGGPVDSVEAVGYALYTAGVGLQTLRVIVTGDIGPGPVARIHIPDSRQASRYSATIGQVAARVTYAQRDPAPYSVSLLP
jgi:hypothetical protein